MNLHHNKEAVPDAITATAQRLDIFRKFIEKDYWYVML